MFDIGLSELMLVAVVALVVIGPERLPKVARAAGHILGRLQRYVSDVKADINREMQLDELKTLQKQMTDQVNSISASVTHEMREVESSVGEAIEPLKDAAAVSPEPVVGEDHDTDSSLTPNQSPEVAVKEATKS
ncbi:MAG: Sec-independent protein translocase protein TatB [Sulfuritalea sp.]|nr:Sec-independent protein translocase protein TatB [Sulfuritalea sp.]